MLTMHIFLAARRGMNTMGGSNEHTYPEPSSTTAPQSSFPALPSACTTALPPLSVYLSRFFSSEFVRMAARV